MKKATITLFTVLFCSLLLLFSCGSDTKSTISAEEEKQVIQKIDSISVELDKKSTKVEEKTLKMKDEVDKLLDGI